MQRLRHNAFPFGLEYEFFDTPTANAARHLPPHQVADAVSRRRCRPMARAWRRAPSQDRGGPLSAAGGGGVASLTNETQREMFWLDATDRIAKRQGIVHDTI